MRQRMSDRVPLTIMAASVALLILGLYLSGQPTNGGTGQGEAGLAIMETNRPPRTLAKILSDWLGW